RLYLPFSNAWAVAGISRLSLHDALPILLTGLSVERRRRLVRNDEPRLVHQCAGDGDTLLLAARQLGRKFVHVLLEPDGGEELARDRKSTRLNSSYVKISYAVFCLKKKR